MDIIEEILKKGTSANKSVAGDDLFKPGTLANVMRDEAKLIRDATGGKSSAKKLDEILSPDQKRKLDAIVKETSRAETIAREGTGRGSPTRQRTVGQGLLNQFGTAFAGPTAGRALQNSTVGNTLTKIPDYLYRNVAEPRIQQILTDMTLDPGNAAKLMARLSPANRSEVRKALESKAVQQVFRALLPAYALGMD